MNNDLLYQVALTRVFNIGDIHAKTLVQAFGNAASVFKAPKRKLERIEGIGRIRAEAIKSFSDFKSCESEILFIEKYNIEPLEQIIAEEQLNAITFHLLTRIIKARKFIMADA